MILPVSKKRALIHTDANFRQNRGDLFQFQGQIHYITSRNEAETVLQSFFGQLLAPLKKKEKKESQQEIFFVKYLKQTAKPVLAWSGLLEGRPLFGLDAEWKPCFTKGRQNKVALLQLCHSNQCYLFHLKFMGGPPPLLIKFLESDLFVKVGVGIRGDISNLKRDYNIETNGTLDLSDFANARLGGDTVRSLSALSASLMNRALSKSKKITMSNWELSLSQKQKAYAASDAAASYDVFFAIVARPQVEKQPLALPAAMVFSFATYKDKKLKNLLVSVEVTRHSTTKTVLAGNGTSTTATPTPTPTTTITQKKIRAGVLESQTLFQSGRSVREISQQRGVTDAKIQSELLDALKSGFEVNLERLGVTEQLRLDVARVLDEVKGLEKVTQLIKDRMGDEVSLFQVRVALTSNNQPPASSLISLAS